MAIKGWKQNTITLKSGAGVYPYSPVSNANIIQIINRKAADGGIVYIDDPTNPNVSPTNYALKVEQGNTGAIVRPYKLNTIYLATDAAEDLNLTVIEIETEDLSFVFNAGQLLQIQGSVQVQQPIQISSGEIEVKNDSGNPIPVTGDVGITGTPNVAITSIPEVEVKNEAGTPLNVAFPSTPTVDVGTLPELPAGTNNIGDVDVLTMPSVTLAGKSAVKVTASGITTVKAAAGVVYDVIVLTAGVTATVRDNATDKWAASDTIHHTPGAPISCATSIVVNLSGAGTAYVIYE